MAENLLKNAYLQKYSSNFKADSNLWVPSWEKKNANLETNDNARSCTETLKH